MKLTIKRVAFLKYLSDVQRVIPSRTTIPILTGIKLVATNHSLMMTGSDSDVSIEVMIETTDEETQLTIHEPGSIVLPAKFFSEIIKKLPSDTFTLTIDEANVAHISAGKASFTLNGLNAAEYPHLPQVEVDQVVTLPVPIFRQLIQHTSIATSTMESRPLLTGIHMILKDGYLKAVATDSHRLSQQIIPLPEENDDNLEYEFTVPGKTLVELSRIVESLDEISMSVTENQVLFHTDGLSFYSRLLDGPYPNVDRLIMAKDSTTTLTVQANTLLAAVERASLMSHLANENTVQLTLAEGIAQLRGNSPEMGTVEEDLVFQELVGDDLVVSFNPDYMKDALRQFGQEEITIRFSSPFRPFTLRPVEDHLDIEYNFVQLITPVRTY